MPLFGHQLKAFFSTWLQLRQEKVQLEQTLEQEQEQQVSKLMKKIDRLEKETTTKQTGLEQVIIMGRRGQSGDMCPQSLCKRGDLGI